MFQIAGYSITGKILEGSSTIIYRAKQTATDKSVIVKVPKASYPTPRELATFRHEYLLLRSLDIPGVVKTFGIEKYGNGLALILEDLRGQSLSLFLRSERPNLQTILRIAIGIVEIIKGIHAQGVIHRDIKPHNIIVDTSQSVPQVHLIDFGAATRVSQDAQAANQSIFLDTSLAYTSPEQTGRMNRAVDHRTDLYSLGVTLYETLTGTLPFTSTDPIELVHSHLARPPVPPQQMLPAIPQVLSDLVMKLLAKAPEDRYQSAYGIKVDLEACLAQWQAKGRIDPFPLALRDHSTELRLSQKLYSRQSELSLLGTAFGRAQKGGAELVLISGPAGIGKSALGITLGKSAAQRAALFTQGRFEQVTRAVPYSAFAQAFRDLCQQLLGEPPDQLARWKEELSAAVGKNGRLLIDLIPELELFIGSQPAPPVIGPTEAQNRFNLVFLSFLKVFTTAPHPLVLFFDDLQWADRATLSLLQVILTDLTRGHLLILGSYRDSEVGPQHPLQLLLDELRNGGATPTTLQLSPLPLEDVQTLLAEALSCPSEHVLPLARTIHEKTHGNPFFVNQFLLSLHHEGLLYFDFAQERWQWNLSEIQSRQVTDNVVEFTAAKIRLLPAVTQHALQLAAVIGNQFDLDMLSRLQANNVQDTAGALWEALREGLCVPVDVDARSSPPSDGRLPVELEHTVSYRFLHDRVQQAAYAANPPAQLPSLHRTIAQMILERSHGHVEDASLFDLANHLRLAAAEITDAKERVQAAQIQLRAGLRAKLTTAYQAAASYLQAGVSVLGASGWEEDYALAFSLNIELAECSYLSAQFEQAERLFENLLPHCRSNLDYARITSLRSELHASKGAMVKALQCGLEALERFGVRFPATEQEQMAALPEALGEFKQLLGDRSISDLLNLANCEDPQQIMIQRLLLFACTPAFFISPTLMPLLVLKLASLSLRHGNSGVTAYAHATYAFIAANFFGSYAEGYEFGKLALEMNSKFNNVALTCRINGVFAGFVSIYQQPLKSGMELLRTGLKAGLETGDFTYVGYCCFHTVTQLFGAGDELSSVLQEAERLIGVAQSTGEMFALGALRVARQAIRNLSGTTQSRGTLSDNDFNEEQFVASFKQAEFTTLECWYYSIKLQLAYLYGDYATAQKMASEAQARVRGALGLHFVTDLNFFTCLTLTALGHQPKAGAEGPAGVLFTLLEQLKKWADCYPDNYRHKYILVKAELARLAGQRNEAIDLYDEAIALAQKSEFTHHAAIACELAGRYLLGLGRTRYANPYLYDAYYAYERWGANSKLAQLLESLPSLQKELAPTGENESSHPTITTSSRLATGGLLDLSTVLHAAQSIVSEIVLDKLLEQVLRLVAANAGAQRGFLLLAKEGALTVEASITIDPDRVEVGLGLPLEKATNLARSIVQLVAHTREAMVFGNVSADSRYANDPYVLAHKPKSLLCLALKNRGRLSGVLYLENNAAEDAFTTERIELLRLLSGQAASAVENALLYARLRDVGEELRKSNDELLRTNADLRQRSEDLRQRSEDLRQANERTKQELAERVRIEEERANLQQEVIRIQESRLAEIAAPLIPITDEIMVMPLIGTMDTARTQQVIHTVLDGSQRYRARVVIIDITGMKHVDTSVASMLLNAATALRLLGTQAVLTGIRPEIAHTLVSLGIDLGGLVTRGTLQSGIAYAVAKIGTTLLGGKNKS